MSGLSESERAAIRARAEAATEAPWIAGVTSSFLAHVRLEDGSEICDTSGTNWAATDAEFIAHARADVPALLADGDYWRARADEENRQANAIADVADIYAHERDALRARAERAEAALADAKAWVAARVKACTNDDWCAEQAAELREQANQ